MKGTVAVAARGPNPCTVEAHDVVEAAIGQRSKEPGMLVHSPSLLVAEVIENGVRMRFPKRAIAIAEHDEHSVFAKADNVCESTVSEVS